MENREKVFIAVMVALIGFFACCYVLVLSSGCGDSSSVMTPIDGSISSSNEDNVGVAAVHLEKEVDRPALQLLPCEEATSEDMCEKLRLSTNNGCQHVFYTDEDWNTTWYKCITKGK